MYYCYPYVSCSIVFIVLSINYILFYDSHNHQASLELDSIFSSLPISSPRFGSQFVAAMFVLFSFVVLLPPSVRLLPFPVHRFHAVCSPQYRVYVVSSSPFTVTCGQFLVAWLTPRLVFISLLRFPVFPACYWPVLSVPCIYLDVLWLLLALPFCVPRL